MMPLGMNKYHLYNRGYGKTKLLHDYIYNNQDMNSTYKWATPQGEISYLKFAVSNYENIINSLRKEVDSLNQQVKIRDENIKMMEDRDSAFRQLFGNADPKVVEFQSVDTALREIAKQNRKLIKDNKKLRQRLARKSSLVKDWEKYAKSIYEDQEWIPYTWEEYLKLNPVKKSWPEPEEFVKPSIKRTEIPTELPKGTLGVYKTDMPYQGTPHTQIKTSLAEPWPDTPSVKQTTEYMADWLLKEKGISLFIKDGDLVFRVEKDGNIYQESNSIMSNSASERNKLLTEGIRSMYKHFNS